MCVEWGPVDDFANVVEVETVSMPDANIQNG